MLLTGIGLAVIAGGLAFVQPAHQPDSTAADPSSPAASYSGRPAVGQDQTERLAAADPALPSFLQLSTNTAALQAASATETTPAIGAPGLLAFAQAPAPDDQADVPTGSVKPKARHQH